MKKIPPIDTRSLRKKLNDVLFRPGDMSSSERRKLLVKYIGEWEVEHQNGVIVNRHHCANTVHDKDIAALLKGGALVTHRVFGFFGTNYTYIKVAR